MMVHSLDWAAVQGASIGRTAEASDTGCCKMDCSSLQSLLTRVAEYRINTPHNLANWCRTWRVYCIHNTVSATLLLSCEAGRTLE